jgi:hypothetical protein
MSELGKLWAGRAYGTNTGNLFVEFDKTGPEVSGLLRFLDFQLGIAVYTVEGTFDDLLILTGHWNQGGEADAHGELSIKARLTSEGHLRGTWSSTIGTGGTLDLFPHELALPKGSIASEPGVPEQIYSRNVSIGALKLYTEDVLSLLRYIQEDFNVPRPVVTYHIRGSEVTKYASDFISEVASLGSLEYLKVTIQEPEAYGINRVVIVELSAFGSNEVRVQGIRESWVIGRAEALASFLRKYQSNLVTKYRKFGLNLNSVIFVAMLVLIPEIATLSARAMFVGATFVLLLGLLWFHQRFIPNASIQLTEAKPNAFVRAWPTILSWVVAASASLIAALVFRWLTQNVP